MKLCFFLFLLIFSHTSYAGIKACEHVDHHLKVGISGTNIEIEAGPPQTYITADLDSPVVTKVFFPNASVKLPTESSQLLNVWRELQSGGLKLSYEDLLTQVSNGGLRLDINQVVPIQVSEITGTFSTIGGSNCFNSALKWFGLVSELKYSEPEELMKLLGSNFMKLEFGEPKRFGDLMVFKRADAKIIDHVSIIINSEYVWQKRSGSSEDPWGIHQMSDALLDYLRKPYCSYNVEYYRQKKR